MICVTRSFVQDIPLPFLEAFGAELPERIIFQLPNGQTTRVKFEQEDGVFNNVQLFYKKFKRVYGQCAMFTYKGNGIFMVNVLNEYLTEVEYDPPTYGKFSILFGNSYIYVVL